MMKKKLPENLDNPDKMSTINFESTSNLQSALLSVRQPFMKKVENLPTSYSKTMDFKVLF
jgi:hypothetical protein